MSGLEAWIAARRAAHPQASLAECVAAMPAADRQAWLAALSVEERAALEWQWPFWARPNQIPAACIPGTDRQWRFWVIRTGRGWGKNRHLALDTEVPTAEGWTTLRDIAVGDRVFEESGAPCRVVAVHDVVIGEPCSRLTLSDGTEIVCSDVHGWRTRTPAERDEGRPATARPTRAAEGHSIEGHSIALAGPLDLPRTELPIDPWVLGYWLGGSGEPEGLGAVLDLFGPSGRTGPPLRSRLERLGLLGNKEIPASYLRAAAVDRWALLQGLTDSAGSGPLEIAGRALADDVRELAVSLGQGVTVTGSGPCRIELHDQDHRLIVEVSRVASVPVRCITVDSPSSTFLVTRSMVPTCNSSIEWLIARVRAGTARHIGIAAKTAGAVRNTVIESGSSSLLRCSPPDFMPEYQPSKRLIVWPKVHGGPMAIAETFSADEPDTARGPQFDTVLADEVAAWPAGHPVGARSSGNECFDNLNMGLRLPTGTPGVPPQMVITSTPRPVRIMQWLSFHKRTLLTTGSMYENSANLDEATVEEISDSYRGTSLEAQEIEGKLLTEHEGALWNRALFVPTTITDTPKLVIAVDPSATVNGAEAGIITAGLHPDDPTKAIVLGDYSTGGGPAAWAARVVEAYQALDADYVVAETNHGGDMVKMVLGEAAAAAGIVIPVKELKASRGKQSRAEPVVLLYQQGRVLHAGDLYLLEDQMCSWLPGTRHPSDRMDAAVWAIWELLLRSPRRYALGSMPGLDLDATSRSNPFDFDERDGVGDTW